MNEQGQGLQAYVIHLQPNFISSVFRFPYCWFSVSHAIQNRSKLKIKTIRQIKSRIWEMKGGRFTKTLAKIWVEGIIRIRDIRANGLPKFIELCMETPVLELIRMSSNMAFVMGD